mmetsp:Transcript_43571/g.69690  ORF Transcript_43571/g.69690 Transcript_43571/m.69690 type:complete len:97 (+) Transcript_43571:4210-4500(+)
MISTNGLAWSNQIYTTLQDSQRRVSACTQPLPILVMSLHSPQTNFVAFPANQPSQAPTYRLLSTPEGTLILECLAESVQTPNGVSCPDSNDDLSRG